MAYRRRRYGMRRRRRFGRRRMRYGRRPMMNKNRFWISRSRPEVKRFVQLSASAADPVASDVEQLYSLTRPVIQGITGTTRLGLRVNPKIITVRAQFNAETPATVVWYVVQWMQDESDNPILVQDIVGTPGSVVSHRNYPNRSNYRILKRGTFDLKRGKGTTDDKKLLLCKIRPRMQPAWTGATEATGTTNHIFFLMYSDVNSLADPPTVDFESAFFFTDP